jgi:hypothetical protein
MKVVLYGASGMPGSRILREVGPPWAPSNGCRGQKPGFSKAIYWTKRA